MVEEDENMRTEYSGKEQIKFKNDMTERIGRGENPKGYIVFAKSTYKDEVSDEQRTYLVDNEHSKALRKEMHGQSIYATNLNQTEVSARVEESIFNYEVEKFIIED